jgi:hypothetical protein
MTERESELVTRLECMRTALMRLSGHVEAHLLGMNRLATSIQRSDEVLSAQAGGLLRDLELGLNEARFHLGLMPRRETLFPQKFETQRGETGDEDVEGDDGERVARRVFR